MKKRLEFKNRRIIKKAGFSLIELLVTIAIIATLIGISTPIYRSYKISSSEKTVKIEALQLLKNAQACLLNTENPSECATENIDGYSSKECYKKQDWPGGKKEGCFFSFRDDKSDLCFTVVNFVGSKKIRHCISVNTKTGEINPGENSECKNSGKCDTSS
ncbi:MAG: type II secretion system protein [Bdellovibrionales bacterium]|nr:type II secretion system protein [Bdellovibrionales bacterium]